jgi:hypothetical protein
VKAKPNHFKKETRSQEKHRPSLHGSEDKLVQKRNKTPRKTGAKIEQQ